MMQSFLNECVSFCVNARSRNRINDPLIIQLTQARKLS